MNLNSDFSTPLLKWYRQHRRDLPWRRTSDPYAIWVSEMMLQQTQVKTVIPYYERWMKIFPNVQVLSQASLETILKEWEGLGYYRRARFLHEGAKMIVKEFDGQFPRDLEDIAKIPGIGPYTLGAIASIAFHLSRPILDGNVIRVLTRWFGVRGDPKTTVIRNKLWQLAEDLIPVKEAGDFNQSLMELGAMVCVPVHPMCRLCPVQQKCWAKRKHAQTKLPEVSKSKKMVRQFEYAGWVSQGNKLLLCQRSEGDRMELLWQFPSVILDQANPDWSRVWQKEFGYFKKHQRITTHQYTVTHHRIGLEFYKLTGYVVRRSTKAKWIHIRELEKLPMTSAHRKMAGWIKNSTK